MKIVICGAGVIGVTSAWYLSQAGHEVTVIERLASAGEETSFANGGQVSVGHTEPWAQPDILPKIFRWLTQTDAPIKFRPLWSTEQWLWGLRFLFECRSTRADFNTQRLAALGAFSLLQLQELRSQLPIEYDGLQKGILHLYDNLEDFSNACRRAEYMEKQGIERKIVGREVCFSIEPALANSLTEIVGGTYTSTDESGDASRFTKALAKACEEKGVLFRFNTNVLSIQSSTPHHWEIVTHSPEGTQTETADVVVIAAGAWSRQLLKPLGLSIPVYPLKGYSATFEIDDTSKAPSVSLTDEGKKMVFSRLGNRYRVAGMAELAGFDKSIDLNRAQLLSNRITQLFPNAMNLDTVDYWTGLRPATPTNVPLIGPTAYPGLYLNTGHGTLGWTLSCGSAAFLTSLIEQEKTTLKPAFYCP